MAAGLGFALGSLFTYKWTRARLGDDRRVVIFNLALCAAAILIAAAPVPYWAQWPLALAAALGEAVGQGPVQVRADLELRPRRVVERDRRVLAEERGVAALHGLRVDRRRTRELRRGLRVVIGADAQHDDVDRDDERLRRGVTHLGGTQPRPPP